MSEYKDKSASGKTEAVFKSGGDSNSGGVRNDRYSNFDGGQHDHTWTHASPDGGYKEGFVPKESDRGNSK